MLIWTAIPFFFLAQGGGSTLLPGLARDYPLPHSVTGLKASRTIAGDLTGDLRPDVVVLVEGQVLFSHGSDTYAVIETIAASVVGSAVRDIEWMAAAGGPRLLALAADGLRVVSYDGATEAFALESTFTDAAWTVAKSIRAADLDGDSGNDYVGISGNGSSILKMTNFDGTSAASQSTISVGGQVMEIEPIDWTDPGVDEIAIRLNARVRVYNVAGGLLYDGLLPNARKIQPFSRIGDTNECLAIVSLAPNTGDDWVTVLGSSLSATSLHLGALSIRGSAAADIDDDGDQDLVFSHEYDYQLLVLENTSESTPNTPFNLADILIYPAGPAVSAAGNRAVPCLVDLDFDGDEDLVVANVADEVLRVQRNSVINELEQWLEIPGEVGELSGYVTLNGPDCIPILDLNYALLEPDTSLPFDGIEWAIWRQPILGAPLDPTPLASGTDDVLPGFNRHYLNFGAQGEGVAHATFYVAARLVERDSGGGLIGAGPTATYHFNFDPLIAPLLDQFFTVLSYPVVEDDNCQGESRTYSGGGSGSTGVPPPGK